MRVEPIRTEKELERIRWYLRAQPRNLLYFTMQLNSGLRVGDLLNFKVKQVKHLQVGDAMMFKERKTQKQNYLVINSAIYECLQDYLLLKDPPDNEYLFRTARNNKPLSVSTMSTYVKRWTQGVGLHGNYSSHSLRKSWGYFQRVKFKTSWELISKRFNHSSPQQTILYLCMQEEEVTKILMNNL